MDKVSFVLPFVPAAMNEIQRKYRHHFARHKYYSFIYDMVIISVSRSKPPEPWRRVIIEVEIALPPRRWRDYDGLLASLKPVIDGLKKAGIIWDDNYRVTGPWLVTQVEYKEDNDGQTRVTVSKRDA